MLLQFVHLREEFSAATVNFKSVIMFKQLYFDISSEQTGGSLYRIDDNGRQFFIYQYSNYDDERDKIEVSELTFNTFSEFWQMIVKDPEWFYLHPLYVHPEQRDFIRQQLENADWSVHANRKWQESHQRQWKKVLTAADDYYRSK